MFFLEVFLLSVAIWLAVVQEHEYQVVDWLTDQWDELCDAIVDRRELRRVAIKAEENRALFINKVQDHKEARRNIFTLEVENQEICEEVINLKQWSQELIEG